MKLDPEQLAERIAGLERLGSPCALCPRSCGADRAAGRTGYCGMGARAVVSSFGPHFGEEPELVGPGGSGTIFFAGCNLLCRFCQNHDISHGRVGEPVDDHGLARIMLGLQARGCSNINLVTPTHFAPAAIRALALARESGLELPLVWNCGGYESVPVIELLHGIADIYMPDAKFGRSEPAGLYCNAPDYPEAMQAALLEMQRQVGDLETDGRGLARRGLLVRHLVMPEGIEDARLVLEFIADKVSPNAYVNVMAQYRPCFEAAGLAPIDRRPTGHEFSRAVELAAALGLFRGLPGPA